MKDLLKAVLTRLSGRGEAGATWRSSVRTATP